MTTRTAIRNSRGMTLLNIVFIFLLIATFLISGVQMYGAFTVRAKVNQTKTGLNGAADAIISWSASQGKIPDATNFGNLIPNTKDSWGKDIVYLYDTNLTAAATGGLCGRTSASSTFNGVNVAFILLSGGLDFKLDSTLNASGALPAGELASKLSTLDIFRIVTLEELKNRAGCYGKTGGTLTILNNELPRGCQNTGTASLFADGGVPFTTAPNTYKWCINDNLTTAGFTVSNVITAADCSTVPNYIWDAFTPYQQAKIGYSAPQGTYTATVFLRDMQKNISQRSYNLVVISGGSCGGGGGGPSIEGEFIKGTTLSFSGNNVSGENASIVLTGGLVKNDINGGAAIAVTNAYIEGDVSLGGSQTLGSPTVPGTVYIQGNLDLSGAAGIYAKNIYVTGNITLQGSPFLGLNDNTTTIYSLGNVSLNNGAIHGELRTGGNLYLKSVTLYKNTYTTGNLTLDWTPSLSSGVTVYYKGSLSAPPNFDSGILSRCVNDTSIPQVSIPVSMPDTTIPPLKADTWYTANGYLTGGSLTNNVKIFASGNYSANGSAANVIIVSKGDITIGSGNDTISGVLFAPNGKITFGGGSFTGYVIAKNGVYITRGGSTLTLKPLTTYIPNSADYPFVYP